MYYIKFQWPLAGKRKNLVSIDKSLIVQSGHCHLGVGSLVSQSQSASSVIWEDTPSVSDSELG